MSFLLPRSLQGGVLDDNRGAVYPFGMYFKKAVGGQYLWLPVSAVDPLPVVVEDAEFDLDLTGTDEILTNILASIGEIVENPADYTVSYRLKLVSTLLGALADPAVTNPASSASVIAAVKGLLTDIGQNDAAMVDAGDVGSLSAKLRRLSNDLDAALTRIGAINDAAQTDPAESASLIALVKGLLTQLASTLDVQLTGSNTGVETSATFQRPDDTNAYIALDVVSDSTSSPTVLTFSNVLPTAGGSFCVARITLEIDVASLPSGMSGFILHLYDTAPTAIADNSPYNVPSADRAKRIGSILIPNPSDLGDTLVAQDVGGLFYGILAAGSTSLYGILQTIGAYTPTALTVKKITMLILPT